MTDHEPTGPPGRARLVALGLTGALALGVVVAVVLSRSPPEEGARSRPGAAARPATEAAATSASSAPGKQPLAVPAPSPAVDARAQTELAEVAALLDTPLALSSPAQWDQWLPQGKPYPGTSTEEDIATCPRLADRLSAALGQKMSYWTGTLPTGPYGCTWVPVPLEYDSPDYDYVIAVGFLADGTTAASLAGGFATAAGPCPWVEVPAAAPGAVLIRCAPGNSTEYTLALPDTRVPGGLWTLVVNVKDWAAVPGSQVLPVLIEGAVAAYG